MLIIPTVLMAVGYVYYYMAGMSPDSSTASRFSSIGSAFIWISVGSLVAL